MFAHTRAHAFQHTHTHTRRTTVLGKYLYRKGKLSTEKEMMTSNSERGELNSRPDLGANLLWDLGQIRDSWKPGLGEPLLSAILPSSFFYLIHGESEVQRKIIPSPKSYPLNYMQNLNLRLSKMISTVYISVLGGPWLVFISRCFYIIF